jgi:hypothetical protein
MSQIKVNSIIPVAGVPTGGGGGIIQMKQTVKTDTFSTTSTSATDVTGLSVSITPTSSTSKILVTYDVKASCENVQMSFFLLRDSTNIYRGDQRGSNRTRTSSVIGGVPDPSEANRTPQQMHVMYIDSPATTSAITYKIQCQLNAGDGYVNRARDDTDNVYRTTPASSITVMEVSA